MQTRIASLYETISGDRAPRQPPDFVILGRDGEHLCIVYAKHKFYDDCRAVQSGDLYQLTVYGMAASTRSVRVVALYPGRESSASRN